MAKTCDLCDSRNDVRTCDLNFHPDVGREERLGVPDEVKYDLCEDCRDTLKSCLDAAVNVIKERKAK